MVHFCMFGGHEGELDPNKKVCITIFGGCELKRPTVAKQILDMRRNAEEHPHRRGSGHFFVTVFGSTELKSPTLAEEYIDLQDALQSDLLKLEDWDWAIAQLAANDAYRIGSFTLFGGFGSSELPSENEELDAMALNNYVGRVPEPAVKMLQLGVGQAGSNRTAVIRQAVATAQAATA